jgi:hypothetical protein
MKDKRISFDGFRSVGRVPLMSCQGMVFSWCIHCERSVKATGRLSIWLRGLRQWLPGLYVSTQAQARTTLFVPVLVSVVALFSFLEFRSHGGAA